MHKITVLGTITRDTIVYPDKKTKQSLGGIVYNILTLSVLGKNRVKVYPVCNVGYDIHDQVVRLLQKHRNIDSAGIKRVNRKNQHNFLHYDEKNNREEFTKNSVSKLTYSQVRRFVDADVILVNFISGSDIDLRTLKRVRTNSRALIFMDIHSFILARARNGRRFVKVPKDWRDWVRCADVVQCNFSEFSALSGKRLTRFSQTKDFARRILLSGPRILLVTKGEEKGYVFQAAKRGVKADRSLVPSLKKIKDPTGCGDVFSAAFLISYLRSKDAVLSAGFANTVATHKCTFSGVKKLSMLSACVL